MAVPDSARQGSTFTLTGANWQPHSKVTLAFNPTNSSSAKPVDLGVTTVDDQGHINFVTIVPSAATPGIWSIAARGDASTAQQEASASFTVLTTEATVAVTVAVEVPTNIPTLAPTDTPQPTPAPTFTPIPAATQTRPRPTSTSRPATATPDSQSQPQLTGSVQGNTLKLSGTGWSAGQNVKIRSSKDQSGKDATSLGQAKVDDKGQFQFSVKLGKQVRDNAYIIVADNDHRVIARVVRGGGD
jgi:hypothetical protein